MRSENCTTYSFNYIVICHQQVAMGLIEKQFSPTEFSTFVTNEIIYELNVVGNNMFIATRGQT